MTTSRQQAKRIESKARANYETSFEACAQTEAELRCQLRHLAARREVGLDTLRQFEAALGAFSAARVAFDVEAPAEGVASSTSLPRELVERLPEDLRSILVGGTGGLGLGAVSAVGTYGAVGALGTASTGTAISTLAGASAHSATMAALGGGSLASGGGGVALGGVVLGGVVAVPLVLGAGAAYVYNGRKQLANARAQAEDLRTEALKCKLRRMRLKVALRFVQDYARETKLSATILRLSAERVEAAARGSFSLDPGEIAEAYVAARHLVGLIGIAPVLPDGTVDPEARAMRTAAERERVAVIGR